MIVADASAVVELLLGPDGAVAEELARRLGGREVVVAPHLVDVECAQVLRRFERAGDLDAGLARACLDDLLDLPIDRYPHRDLLPRAFELRANVTAYDGVYLALAEALDAPLLTADTRLVEIPGCAAEVLVPS